MLLCQPVQLLDADRNQTKFIVVTAPLPSPNMTLMRRQETGDRRQSIIISEAANRWRKRMRRQAAGRQVDMKLADGCNVMLSCISDALQRANWTNQQMGWLAFALRMRAAEDRALASGR